MSINSPWKVVDLRGDWALRAANKVVFPWGIADCWGVVIGRFDTEDQARRAADAVNHEVIRTP